MYLIVFLSLLGYRLLFPEFGVINDDAIRYKIIPAIDALYAKTHRPAYMSDVSRKTNRKQVFLWA
ncbi:hypothetical protein ACKUEJ_25410, partial [Escherichia coli]|uniref:hypothetical protein n=1 Tax=Escherichia coli TaxID=562 RepID=UPI00390C6838